MIVNSIYMIMSQIVNQIGVKELIPFILFFFTVSSFRANENRNLNAELKEIWQLTQTTKTNLKENLNKLGILTI